jgi:tRNA threonylcarbamoyladenosine biosynthesis protein TsaE
MPLRILPALREDLDAILSLVHRSFARNGALGYKFWGVDEPMETLERDFVRGAVFKGMDADRMVASIRLHEKVPGKLYVNRLCVDPEAQTGGIGSEMMRFAEDEARRRGCACVALDTAKPFTELVEWYEHRGYRVVAEAQWETTNYPSVIMEKRVGPDSASSTDAPIASHGGRARGNAEA